MAIFGQGKGKKKVTKKKATAKKEEAPAVEETPDETLEDMPNQLEEMESGAPIKETPKPDENLVTAVQAAHESPDLLSEDGGFKEENPMKGRPDTRKQYHIGTTKDSPFFNISVGGVCFPRTTETMTTDGQGGTSRSPHIGDVLKLSKEQVERIKDAANRIVVRLRKKRGHLQSGVKMNSKSKRYRPSPDDVPIARFIYMKELPENADWRSKMPQSMA